MSGVITLSGWGQPHDALAAIAPDALHVDYARDPSLPAALNLLKAHANAHTVVGWSMGGQVAVRAIAEGILKPQQLFLIATPLHFARTGTDALGMGPVTLQKFRDNFIRAPERTLDKAYALIAHNDKNEDVVKKYVTAMRARVPDYNWLYWLDTIAAESAGDIDFSAFPPTTLLHGDHDVVVDIAQSHALKRAFSAARLQVFEGCGHAPHWHDTARVRDLVERVAA